MKCHAELVSASKTNAYKKHYISYKSKIEKCPSNSLILITHEEAKEVFDDPFHISIMDKRFDYFEERWITIGSSKNERVIVIGHLYFLKEDGEEVIRIITARKTTKKEREQYENINY